MENSQKMHLITFLQSLLVEQGDHNPLQDDQPLFSNGRLDSLNMTRIVVFLEQQFGIDFSSINFDIDLIDSVEAIESLIKTYQIDSR